MKFLWQSLKMAAKNILRNKLVNFLCLGIIAFTLLVLGIFGVVSDNLNQYIAKVSQNISAIVYLQSDTSEENTEAVMQRIQGSLLVEKAKTISTDDAKYRFIREFPELSPILSEFKNSPFPSSIEITFKETTNIIIQIESFIKEIRKIPGVEDIQLNTDWAKRIEKFKKLIAYVGFFLSFILIFVTIFVVFNVIKLNIFYRRDEIVIFKLVGATNFYIRLPFLLEGVILGTLGAALAGLLLLLVLKAFSLYGGFLIEIVRGMIDIRRVPVAIYIRLIVVGAPIGFFSALFSLQRFLRSRRPTV